MESALWRDTVQAVSQQNLEVELINPIAAMEGPNNLETAEALEAPGLSE